MSVVQIRDRDQFRLRVICVGWKMCGPGDGTGTDDAGTKPRTPEKSHKPWVL
jgi:hypothetical protein